MGENPSPLGEAFRAGDSLAPSAEAGGKISVGSFGGVKTVTGAEKSAYKAEHFLVH
jgi:hypothetical protein